MTPKSTHKLTTRTTAMTLNINAPEFVPRRYRSQASSSTSNSRYRPLPYPQAPSNGGTGSTFLSQCLADEQLRIIANLGNLNGDHLTPVPMITITKPHDGIDRGFKGRWWITELKIRHATLAMLTERANRPEAKREEIRAAAIAQQMYNFFLEYGRLELGRDLRVKYIADAITKREIWNFYCFV